MRIWFFFFFLSLGFLTFKNIFHLTPWWWCLPATHSLSQIYSLGIPRGHLWLFTDHLFRAHDLQRPSYFLVCRVPGSFHQHRCRKTEAVLSQLPQFPHSGQQICSMLTLSSLISEAGSNVSTIIFFHVALIRLPPISLGISSHIFKLIFKLISQ